MKLLYASQKLYSFNGEDPAPIPESIRMPDGLTRTDSSTFTDEEILLAGYVLAPAEPEINEKTQNCSWDGNQWIITEKTSEEIQIIIDNQWHTVRSNRNIMLAQTDWMVIRSIETGTPLANSVSLYRQSLRDITLQEDPFNIQWPKLDIGATRQ